MKFKIRNNRFLINEILEYGAHLQNKGDLLVINSIDRINDEDRIKFHLPIGIHQLKYNNGDITINYEKSEKIVGTATSPDHYEELTITLEKDIIEDFMKDAHEFCRFKPLKNEIVTHIFKQSYWCVLSKLPKRNLDTIYLPEKMKKNMVDDIENFLGRETAYLKFGIPYKRNYLFEGLHGTGKTSFIYSLASHFNMDIAVINFNMDLDDNAFMRAVSKIPKKTFLILEDIDALFVERKINVNTMVTFSGILNILDGVARKNGQITFITTNYANKLDRALIRPGRIDKKISFTYAKKSQIKAIFDVFFPEKEELWKEFSKKSKRLKTTVACLQSYFFSNMDSIMENYKELEEMSNEIVKSDNGLYI